MAVILLADDDERVRFALALVLRDAGHEVHEADYGGAVLQSMDAVRPDLVIADLFMPEMDGIELIKRLRKTRSDVRILAISGGGMHNDPGMATSLAKLAGADRVMAKPIENEVLLREVAELVPDAGGQQSADDS